MKKILMILAYIIRIPLMMIGFIGFSIFYVLPAPLEILRFNRSRFHKDSKIKYKFGASYIDIFKIYNIFTKLGLSLNIKETSQGFVYFLYEGKISKTLVFPAFTDLIYSKDQSAWHVQVEDGSYMSLNEAIQFELDQYGLDYTDDVILLVNHSITHMDESLFKDIYEDTGLLIYGHFIEIIETIDPEASTHIEEEDIERVYPVSLTKLISAIGYIVLAFLIYQPFFTESNPILIITGTVFYLVFLAMIGILINESYILKRKFIKFPTWFIDLVTYIGLLAILTGLIQWLM
ncbi:MAG TPA: hypothetical protein VJ878_02000 [Candidatus Izemoplasmatales bacterium]|nr:hypothetical protein [Candidatus Izemoplasmatales bacterium]